MRYSGWLAWSAGNRKARPGAAFFHPGAAALAAVAGLGEGRAPCPDTRRSDRDGHRQSGPEKSHHHSPGCSIGSTAAATRAGYSPARAVATNSAAEDCRRNQPGRSNWMVQPKLCTLMT